MCDIVKNPTNAKAIDYSCYQGPFQDNARKIAITGEQFHIPMEAILAVLALSNKFLSLRSEGENTEIFLPSRMSVYTKHGIRYASPETIKLERDFKHLAMCSGAVNEVNKILKEHQIEFGTLCCCGAGIRDISPGFDSYSSSLQLKDELEIANILKQGVTQFEVSHPKFTGLSKQYYPNNFISYIEGLKKRAESVTKAREPAMA